MFSQIVVKTCDQSGGGDKFVLSQVQVNNLCSVRWW